MDRKRRTHPSYLSNDEAARERRRTEELVRSLVGKNLSTSSVMEKRVLSLVRNQTTRVGETNCFAVDFNDKDKCVILCGKEIPEDSSFKLRFSMGETVAIYRLLGKALGTMRNSQQSMRIGEKNTFVVDYDGTQRLVMVYQKEKAPLCQFKLAFDEDETMWIIHYLRKAKNFFWC